MKVQCENFMFPYAHSLSNSPTLQSNTNTSLRHADSGSKPGQMMNTMTGIITMSSGNRWMTKMGWAGADNSVLWLNTSKYLAKLRHRSLEFLEYSEFLL